MMAMTAQTKAFLVVVVLVQAILIVWMLLNQFRRQRIQAALRLSELRYREIVDGQHEMVCRYQADGVLTFVNAAYCRFFDKTAEELCGRSFFTLIPESAHKSVADSIHRLSQGER